MHYSHLLAVPALFLTSVALVQAAPPEIQVVGRHLEEKATPGKKVRLTGANLPSLEWGNGENLTGSASHILNVWKGNVIRLPIDQPRWLAGGAYQTTVDNLVNQVSAANAYIIIDCHEYKQPDLNAIAFWTSVASRPLYKNNPAVLFGLLNEPHGITWDVWKNGDANGPGLQAVLDAVRATGANNIAVVGGLGYASQLDGIVSGEYALTDSPSGNGILYDVHIYPWHGWTNWVIASRTLPLLIGECGHDGSSTGGTGTSFGGNSPMLYWQELGMADALGMSYTPFAFHLSAGPKLLQDNTAYTPTSVAGQFVMNHLLSIRDSASESTVLNPSFESPSTSTYAYRPTGGTWSFAGNSGIQKTWSPAIDGSQTAFLQTASATDAGQNGQDGSITQTLNFDKTGSYTISFLLAQRSGKTELPIRISVDGVSISSVEYTPCDVLGDNLFYSTVTAPFTVNSVGSHTIKLQAVASTGLQKEALIDNVMITATAPGIVPDQGFQLAKKTSGALSSGQFRYRPIGSSWVFSGNSGVEYNALGAPVAPEGRYPMAAFLQTAIAADAGGQDGITANSTDGAIETPVEFAAAGMYSFTFKAATRTGKGNLDIQIYVDNIYVGTVTPTTTAFALYSSPAFPIYAPGYHTIRLAAAPSPSTDKQAFVDATLITVPATNFTRPAPVPIANAGFETPSSATVTSFLAPAGNPWTFTGKCTIASDLSGFKNYDGHHASDGYQKLAFQGNGLEPATASQSIQFPASGNYAINFQAQRGRNGVVPLTITVDGAVVGTHAPTLKAFYPYTTAPFYVTAGTHIVKMECPAANSTTGIFTLVDSVNIWPVPSVAALPTPWINQDIGTVLTPGQASYQASAFTVAGAGSDLWNTADSFHYAFYPASGDCDITARVVSQTGGSTSAKATVMIREQLTAGSKNVTMQRLRTSGSLEMTQRAAVDGATGKNASSATYPANNWLRLVRTGNTFTAFHSADGATWVQLGAPLTSVTMGTDVYIGLAVCAKSSGLTTGVYDNVTVNP